MSLTVLAERKLLDHYFQKAAWATPFTHLGLLKVMPTDTTSGTECDYTGYARIAFVPASWGAAATVGDATSIKNSAKIAFPQNTAVTAQDVLAVGFYDASTGGNLIDWMPLTGGALNLAQGDSYEPNAGQLEYTAD